MWALWRPRRHSPGSGQAHHGARPPGHLRLPGRSTATRGCARADAGQWSVPSEAWRSSGVAEAIGSPVRGPCWAQAVEVAEGLHIWCLARRHAPDRCTVATPLVVCTRVWRARGGLRHAKSVLVPIHTRHDWEPAAGEVGRLTGLTFTGEAPTTLSLATRLSAQRRQPQPWSRGRSPARARAARRS